jgi:maleate cis-trans isomerase
MHHFGVLVPSTNTIVEIEYGRLLPPNLQVHVARIPLLSRGSDDTDVDYQARLLGSAKVEVVARALTGATLSADDYGAARGDPNPFPYGSVADDAPRATEGEDGLK